MAQQKSTIADDLIVGGPAIARELGMPDRQFYYLAANGRLGNSVQKLGPKIYVASRAKLRARLGLVSQSATAA